MINSITAIAFCIDYFKFPAWSVIDSSERALFPTHRIHFFFPHVCCWIVITQLHKWHSFCCCAPNHWELLAFFYYFFISVCFICSFFLLLYFCLSPGWLEWVSRWLCCVVFDSNLGAKLSLMQLLGPTIFLKSVSINIIMVCSRHHWIFYCNIEQNITPHSLSHRESLIVWQKLFIFDWKVLVRSVASAEVFVFCCVSSLVFRKNERLPFDKVMRVFFFLSSIYYWHFPGIGLGELRVDVLYLIVNLTPHENRVVQACSFVRHPHCVCDWLQWACVFRKCITYLLLVKNCNA